MKNEDKKILFGLSFPALMVAGLLALVFFSNKK
jgi:hypothetical protein